MSACDRVMSDAQSGNCRIDDLGDNEPAKSDPDAADRRGLTYFIETAVPSPGIRPRGTYVVSGTSQDPWADDSVRIRSLRVVQAMSSVEASLVSVILSIPVMTDREIL